MCEVEEIIDEGIKKEVNGLSAMLREYLFTETNYTSCSRIVETDRLAHETYKSARTKVGVVMCKKAKKG